MFVRDTQNMDDRKCLSFVQAAVFRNACVKITNQNNPVKINVAMTSV